jgi:FkbM family methyltransferase
LSDAPIRIDFHPARWKRFVRKLDWLVRVYLRPQHIASVQTQNGLLSFDSKDKTTGRLLWVYRQHEFDEIQSVAEYLLQGGLRVKGRDTLLDIGGYIGMTSIAFLQEGHFKRAIAIEASPKNFDLLKQNVVQNDVVDRVNALNVAVGAQNRDVSFELSSKNHGDNRLRNQSPAFESQSDAYGEAARDVISVPLRTLDSLVAEGFLDDKSVGLVWMDIQGAEPGFFLGATEFLRNNQCVPMFLEFWPYGMDRSGLDLKATFTLLEDCFDCFVDWTDGKRQQQPIQRLRGLYELLRSRAKQEGEPGVGSSVLLLPRACVE